VTAAPAELWGRAVVAIPYAIVRGGNGRRHEVDFGDAPVPVEVYSSEETVEIFIQTDFEELPQEHRRFAFLSIPRHLFSEAVANAKKPRWGEPGFRRRTIGSGENPLRRPNP
jgi:hypothetical protein